MSPTNQISITDLPITPIDNTSPIPLYYQVEADLRTLLTSNYVNAGDLIPTEHELAEAYGVGRHTIRTALARLVNDNLITRKAGFGTIVNTRSEQRTFSLNRSFTRQMIEMGLTPRSIILGKEIRTVHPNDPKPLQSKLDSQCLVLDRLRFGNDHPIGIQRAYVVLDRCPDVANWDFSEISLYDVLANNYRLVITEIRHAVSATVSDKRQSELLLIEPRSPLLKVNTSAFLENHELIEFSTSFYRADKYEYVTTHTSS